jgi:hypothetical protein
MPIQFDLKKFTNPCFVETGFWKGAGVLRASRAGFKKIYSIEILEDKVRDAPKNKKIKELMDSGAFKLVHGNSRDKLPGILSELSGKKITFWLDAHNKSKDNPLYDELKSIGEHDRDDHIILIDDIRLWDYWGVDRKRIMNLLKSINKKYKIVTMHGVKKDDVLAAYID